MPRSPAPSVFISHQIEPADLADYAADGVVRVICNRPDGEEWGQPSAEHIAEAAGALGMEFHFLPARGLPDEAVVSAVGELVEDGRPTLLYCKSGLRSVAAWGLSQVRSGKLSREQMIEAGARAGYDLSGLPITA